MVLLYVMWWGAGGAGCFVTHFINDIQACMDVLLSGYQLQIINISGFQHLSNEVKER